ncbi:MAG: DUF805 domain-containing protein [Bacteroidetes bacterium]|nr:DUF805 domain-containing protein [Bacteroidota bacterium]
MKGFLNKYFCKPYNQAYDFEGRTSRKECWIFYLLNSCFQYSGGYIFKIIFGILNEYKTNNFFGYLLTILFIILHLSFYISIIITTLSITVRRMHDIGRTGWWAIALFICWILALFPGDKKENKYGPPT